MTLAIRMPAWSRETILLRNGKPADFKVKDGYAYLSGHFAEGDEIAVTLDMSARKVFPSEKVSADSARVAFTRGPLVYCAEGADNAGDVLSLRVRKDTPMEAHPTDALGGVVTLRLEGWRTHGDGTLYSYERPQAEPCDITLIPYYAWANRGLNEMRVWLPEA